MTQTTERTDKTTTSSPADGEPEPAPSPRSSRGASWWYVGVAALVLIPGVAIPLALDAPARAAEARIRANEAGALARLESIRLAQNTFRECDKDGDGVFQYAQSVDELVAAELLGPDSPGVTEGYRVRFLPEEQPRTGWTVVAEPLEPGVTGRACLLAGAGRDRVAVGTPYLLKRLENSRGWDAVFRRRAKQAGEARLDE